VVCVEKKSKMANTSQFIGARELKIGLFWWLARKTSRIRLTKRSL
jgi:hypothetical protein